MSKAVVKFNRRVIYKGVMRHPGTPFEVEAIDLESLKESGAFEVLQAQVQTEVPPTEPDGQQAHEHDEDDIITDGGINLSNYDWDNLDKVSHDELKDISKALGINLPGNSKKVEFIEAISAQLVEE